MFEAGILKYYVAEMCYSPDSAYNCCCCVSHENQALQIFAICKQLLKYSIYLSCYMYCVESYIHQL